MAQNSQVDLVRLFEVIDEHFAFPLDEWQRFVFSQLYSHDGPIRFIQPRPRLPWTSTGRIQRGPAGAPPSFFDWGIVDEVTDFPQPPEIDEARQLLIDAISDDVEANIARTECPRFPRADA